MSPCRSLPDQPVYHFQDYYSNGQTGDSWRYLDQLDRSAGMYSQFQAELLKSLETVSLSRMDQRQSVPKDIDSLCVNERIQQEERQPVDQ
jgi:hypothetical protein